MSKAKITLECYDTKYTIENIPNDSTAQEMQEIFDRLLVQAGYSMDIRCADGGRYEITYKEEDES